MEDGDEYESSSSVEGEEQVQEDELQTQANLLLGRVSTFGQSQAYVLVKYWNK